MGACDTRLDILVIEDDPGIAGFLVDMLRYEGYRAASLADGTALEPVCAAPPRLILLDLMLPAPDGAAICRQLRADERTSALPIVIMTAASAVARAQRLRDCTYEALLSKPFDIEDLLALVERHLRPAQASPEGEAAAPEAGPDEVAVSRAAPSEAAAG